MDMWPWGKRDEKGMNQEMRSDACTLPGTKQIADGKLLYKELSSGLHADLEGWDEGIGRRSKRERIRVYT